MVLVNHGELIWARLYFFVLKLWYGQVVYIINPPYRDTCRLNPDTPLIETRGCSGR